MPRRAKIDNYVQESPKEPSKVWLAAPPWAIDVDLQQAPPRTPPAHALWDGSRAAVARRSASLPPYAAPPDVYVDQMLPGSNDNSPDIALAQPPLPPPLDDAPPQAMPEVAPLPGGNYQVSKDSFEPQEGEIDRGDVYLSRPPPREDVAGTGIEPSSGEPAPATMREEAKAVRPVPVFYNGGAPAESGFSDGGHHPYLQGRLGFRDFVSPKIGTRESGGVGQLARNTQWVHEDTEARARGVYQRQSCDTVGSLLSGSEPARRRSHSVGAVASAGSQSHEKAAGKFVYRVRDAGPFFEVEAQLPGGNLLRVLRNPLRRTLTFEGEAAGGQSQFGSWSPAPSGPEARPPQERLVVRIPPGIDLVGAPAHVERAFSEGHCLVALHRCNKNRKDVGSATLTGGEV